MTLHLSLFLPILAVTQASPSCDWFAAAQANSALSYFSKLHLWRMRQLDQVCKKTFHLLPASSLPYVSTYLPENEDKVGAFLQFYAEKVEEVLMHLWLSNYTSAYWKGNVKFEWDPEELIKETMMVHDREANTTVASLEELRTYILKNIEDGNIYNMYNTLWDSDHGFHRKFRFIYKYKTLKMEEWLIIYDALYCTLTMRNGSESSVDFTVFRKLMKIDGWENTDDDRINPALAKLTDRGINAAIDLVWLYREQMQNFLNSFTEEMTAYQDTVLQILNGEIPELENLIFDILGEVQSGKFLQNIDSLFNAACVQRFKNIWNQVDTTIAKLTSKLNFLSKSINAENTLDVFILISEIDSNLEEVNKELQEIIERGFNAVKRMLKDQGYAKTVLFEAFLPIFFPACKQHDACQEKKQILLKQSKILTGLILRAFAKKDRFDMFHYSTRQPDGSYLRRGKCRVDCSRDCPDIGKEDYQDGCWSFEACTKNLFYDTEKC